MPTREHEQLINLLHDFDAAMLVTHTPEGHMRGRPMMLTDVEDSGVLWFISGERSGKIDEIEQNPDMLITFQNDRQRYISLSGFGALVRDKSKIADLWKESYKAWFPQGKDDPNITLIRVEPREAEYWDNKGGNGVAMLFETVKAYATNTTPEVKEPEQHAKVRL